MEISSRIRAAILTALGILLSLGIVAVASRGTRPEHEIGSRHAGDVLLDILFALYLLGIALGALLVLYMLLLRRKFLHAHNVGRRSILETVAAMLLFLGFGLFLAHRLANSDPIVPPE